MDTWLHDRVGGGACLRVFCDLTELSDCTVFQLAIFMMGLRFSCNNKVFFLKNVNLGCFPFFFLCLIELNQDEQLLFLSIPADVKQMLSISWG